MIFLNLWSRTIHSWKIATSKL
nr:unnamed protein product [Callosobruchus chinensis]